MIHLLPIIHKFWWFAKQIFCLVTTCMPNWTFVSFSFSATEASVIMSWVYKLKWLSYYNGKKEFTNTGFNTPLTSGKRSVLKCDVPSSTVIAFHAKSKNGALSTVTRLRSHIGMEKCKKEHNSNRFLLASGVLDKPCGHIQNFTGFRGQRA